MTALIHNRLPEVSRRILENIGISLMSVPEHPFYDEPVCGHPDLFAFADGDTVIAHPSLSPLLADRFTVITADIPHENARVIYPHDCKLCAVKIGKIVIADFRHLSPTLIRYIESRGYRKIAVKQGYAACNVCTVSDNALITEDAGIARACTDAGLDVLHLQTHAVNLDGYDYGFIGGASGSFTNEKGTSVVTFCGNIAAHPEYARIKDFCEKHRAEILSLGDYPLTDFGSILYIDGQ